MVQPAVLGTLRGLDRFQLVSIYIANPDHLIVMWERIRRERRRYYPDEDTDFFEGNYDHDLVQRKQWEDYMDWWMVLPEKPNQCLHPDSVDGAGALSKQGGQERAEKDFGLRKRKLTDEAGSGSLPSSPPLAGKRPRTKKDKASEEEGPSAKQLDELRGEFRATMEIFGKSMTRTTKKVERPVHQLNKAMARLKDMETEMQNNMNRLQDELLLEQNRIFQAVAHTGTQMRFLGTQMSKTMETLGEMKGKVTDS